MGYNFRKRVRGRIVSYILLFAFLLFLLFPIYWMIITSLKQNKELYNFEMNPLLVTQGITLRHYSYLFERTNFMVWMRNSIIICLTVIVFTIVVSSLAAYSLSRLRFKGRWTMALAVFAAYLVPPTLLFIPLYRIVVLLDLPDTILGLIVTYPSFTVPFSTWLLIGYFRNIPSSLEESALVDGATRLQVLWRIVLPVALPGVATVTIFSFTLSWAQFLFPSAFISSSMKKPLAVGVVSELIRGDIFHWGSLMAGASLGIIPVLLIYVFFSRFFIRGIMAGSLKG